MGTETVIAVSAVTVALAALFVSVWQSVQMRKHNQLSVRPHLRFDTVTAPAKAITLVVGNTGLGPAVITGLRVYVDRQPVGEQEPLKAIVKAKDKIGLAAYEWACALPVCGDTLATKETMHLLSFPHSVDESSERASILSKIGRLSISITYESMYGERFNLSGTPQGPIEPRQASAMTRCDG